MKDPEQMTKHELVQTIYKLAEVNQELVEVLQCVCDDGGDENADIRTKTYLKVLQALAKYKEFK